MWFWTSSKLHIRTFAFGEGPFFIPEKFIFNKACQNYIFCYTKSMPDKSKKIIGDLLALADIKLQGDRPWDIQVKNEAFYSRVLAGASMALGESYMDAWWQVKDLAEFFNKLLSANLDDVVRQNKQLLFDLLKSRLFNRQSKKRAWQVGEQHYNIGNELYKNMLDKRLVYTCGYWAKADNLDQAQEDKLDLVCRKIGLKAGDKVMDIGSGWGSFAKFAAEKYGASVIGYNVSSEQVSLSRELCRGLPVEFKLKDYREADEKVDHIVSLGMIEHVGYKNYRQYMKVVERCLSDKGLFLLQTIGSNKSVTYADPWIEKYIFPNGMLPSIKQLASAMEGLFVMEDWHSFGAYYDRTLLAWYDNFFKNWGKIKNNYDDRFFRMWQYYLLVFAGSFRSRKNQLWQIVLSKHGVPGGYKSIR